MSWRGKYVEWYRLLESELESLVPKLNDQDIMEYVSPDDWFLAPTIKSHEDKSKKELPQIYFALTDTQIKISIAYKTKNSIDHFQNIFRDTHQTEKKELLDILTKLDPSYETTLYKTNKDTDKPEILRKYVTNRLDEQLIQRMIEEADNLRKGGRQIQNNQSTYVPPQNPTLHLVEARLPLNETQFTETLQTIKPIYKILTEIKTQQEIIAEQLEKPKKQRNLYREFVDLLNQARKQGLISAERRRELNARWRMYPDEHEDLIDGLKKLLNPPEFPQVY